MPLTTHYSYSSVLRDFVLHWEGYEELADLVIGSGVTRAGLRALHTSLDGQMDKVLDGEAALAAASRAANSSRRELRKRLVEWNAVARQWCAGLPEAEMVPRVETITAAPDKFCRPVREALRLWQVINNGPAPEGLTLPMVLRGGFSRADMEALRAQFDADRLAEEDAEFALGLDRARRDALEAEVRGVLVSYNQIVMAQYGEDEIIASSKPRLFPLPGSTPDAVALTGVWDPARRGAALTWEASTETKVTGYQLRWYDGPVYQRRGSRVVKNFPVEAPREYLAQEAHAATSGTATYCLYVMKQRGRHKGSKPLTVTPPPPPAG